MTTRATTGGGSNGGGNVNGGGTGGSVQGGSGNASSGIALRHAPLTDPALGEGPAGSSGNGVVPLTQPSSAQSSHQVVDLAASQTPSIASTGTAMLVVILIALSLGVGTVVAGAGYRGRRGH